MNGSQTYIRNRALKKYRMFIYFFMIILNLRTGPGCDFGGFIPKLTWQIIKHNT